jgi:hypothetical protein
MVPALEQSSMTFDYLSRDELERKFGLNTRFGFDFASFHPPKRIDDPTFGAVNQAVGTCGVFMEETGYVADPQLATENFRIAAELSNRVTFRFGATVSGLHDKA